MLRVTWFSRLLKSVHFTAISAAESQRTFSIVVPKLWFVYAEKIVRLNYKAREFVMLQNAFDCRYEQKAIRIARDLRDLLFHCKNVTFLRKPKFRILSCECQQIFCLVYRKCHLMTITKTILKASLSFVTSCWMTYFESLKRFQLLKSDGEKYF